MKIGVSGQGNAQFTYLDWPVTPFNYREYRP